MNRSQTDTSHARSVRVDALLAQMHRTDRAAVVEAIARQDVAELERAEIARRIKQAREEAGLSQVEMAEAVGVIPRTYQNYESVKEPRTPWGSMNDIAKITGKSTEWLIHGEAAQTPDPFAAGQSRLADLEAKIDQLIRTVELLSPPAIDDDLPFAGELGRDAADSSPNVELPEQDEPQEGEDSAEGTAG